jgi:signal transduction histidine kinase
METNPVDRGDGTGKPREAGVAREAIASSRIALVRHAAISLAALTAYLLRRELHVTASVLWVIGVAALVNVASSTFVERPATSRVVRAVSPTLAIAAWGVLVARTGGAASPFVAGIWLEIVLSGQAESPLQIPVATVVGLIALWAAALPSLGLAPAHLGLETTFLLAMGGLTSWMNVRSKGARDRLSADAALLASRLRALESELDGCRALGQVGDGVARLVHGLKNTVHSLRGFSTLIETAKGRDHRQQAIAGLRLAIDELDKVTHDLLRPRSFAPPPAGATAAEVSQAMDDVIADVGARYPGIRWIKLAEASFSAIALSSSALREVLTILFENAAEACANAGRVSVAAEIHENMMRLHVQDDGPGIAPGLRDALFTAGFTTKASGHGYGLLLAQRLVESRGGRLTAGPAPSRGATFSVSLPLQG